VQFPYFYTPWYWVVVLSLYMEANMRTTPLQPVGHKMVAMTTPVA